MLHLLIIQSVPASWKLIKNDKKLVGWLDEGFIKLISSWEQCKQSFINILSAVQEK